MNDIDRPITERERELYRSGDYWFMPPPVCHDRWDEDAWIRHIRATGGWN